MYRQQVYSLAWFKSETRGGKDDIGTATLALPQPKPNLVIKQRLKKAVLDLGIYGKYNKIDCHAE